MNKHSLQFMRAVALSRPAYAFGETGDVAPTEVKTDYPSPPVFSVNELLPALRKETNKATVKTALFGVAVGAFLGWIGTSAFHSPAFRK